MLIGAGREDLSKAFGPFIGFPTSVLVARDGKVCVRHVGVVEQERSSSGRSARSCKQEVGLKPDLHTSVTAFAKL